MASTKIDGIWQLLSTYEFGNDIPENYHCIICRKVAIEPYAALCECTFCSECIKEYLKDKRKHCPGIKNDCAEEYLEIDKNVSKDIRAIRNIGRISVKCPNEMCDERGDLENMNDHLRVCSMTKTKCLYENIGCQLRKISGDNLKTHYDKEWFFHSKLLIEAINNLRNDVEEVKKVVERRDEEIIKLKEDSVVKEMTIKEMRIDIDILKEINQSKDREMEEMKDEFRIMKETQKKTMMEELENVKKDIVEREVRRDIEDQKKRLNDLGVNQENIERKLDSVNFQVRESRIFDERGEFLWRVDNFSKMRDTAEPRHVILMKYSRRFCFVLNFWGGSLHILCRVMRCEFDNNNLIWPMGHKITLSLINQESMKIHKSKTYKYNACKYKEAFLPTLDDWNYSFIGFVMTLKDITDSPGVLLNDSLIVSFQIIY